MNHIVKISILAEYQGVDYDHENCGFYYREEDGISYILKEVGGGLETLVMSYIYWSEKEQRVKRLFLTGDGNTYNTLTHSMKIK